MLITKEQLKSIPIDHPVSKTAFASAIYTMYSPCHARRLLSRYIQEHNLVTRLNVMRIHAHSHLLATEQMQLIIEEMTLDAIAAEQRLSPPLCLRQRRRRRRCRKKVTA